MKAKVGVGVIITAYLASLNPYWLIFAIPIFLLGVILVFTSPGKIKTKVLSSIIPIIAWYPGMLLFYLVIDTAGAATAQKIDLIFPGNFRGRAIVVSEMKCGQPVKVIEGREQLVFPENGILLYQGKIETGRINHNYYFVDNEGVKKEIPTRDDYMYWDSELNQPDSTITGVWVGGMGASFTHEPNTGIAYSFMFLDVTSKENRNKYYDSHYLRQFEAETDSLVQNCR